MCDRTPSHSATGSGLPISITAAQIKYEQNKDGGKLQSDKKSQSRKGPEKTLEVDIALNRVPLQSTAGPSQLITVDTAGGNYEQKEGEGSCTRRVSGLVIGASLSIHRVFNHPDCQEVGCLCLGSFLLSACTI